MTKVYQPTLCAEIHNIYRLENDNVLPYVLVHCRYYADGTSRSRCEGRYATYTEAHEARKEKESSI